MFFGIEPFLSRVGLVDTESISVSPFLASHSKVQVMGTRKQHLASHLSLCGFQHYIYIYIFLCVCVFVSVFVCGSVATVAL